MDWGKGSLMCKDKKKNNKKTLNSIRPYSFTPGSKGKSCFIRPLKPLAIFLYTNIKFYWILSLNLM